MAKGWKKKVARPVVLPNLSDIEDPAPSPAPTSAPATARATAPAPAGDLQKD